MCFRIGHLAISCLFDHFHILSYSEFLLWNRGELESFLVEITADIFKVRDDKGSGELVDMVLDKTGMKGTGKWTVQQAAELAIVAPTIAASLDSRFLSGLKDEREAASRIFSGEGLKEEINGAVGLVDKKRLIDDDNYLRLNCKLIFLFKTK
ncbi:dehydrogenase [Lithospermum erythrorhizon]|uniref:phosphogluconate dehydrogenase (NADP(+)-dependent, decarboxylating) n=1 Tax=Lithospermum erythrorhizon TaxID=34254 RepID=A0AAV3R007_LITER